MDLNGLQQKFQVHLVALIVMSGIAVGFGLDYRTIQEIPSGIPQIKWEFLQTFL